MLHMMIDDVVCVSQSGSVPQIEYVDLLAFSLLSVVHPMVPIAGKRVPRPVELKELTDIPSFKSRAVLSQHFTEAPFQWFPGFTRIFLQSLYSFYFCYIMYCKSLYFFLFSYNTSFRKSVHLLLIIILEASFISRSYPLCSLIYQ